MSTKNSPWTILKTGYTEDGALIELRYAAFGKGRAKCHYWRIYRDGVQIGYAATAGDAEENFDRAASGLEWERSTGNWIPFTR